MTTQLTESNDKISKTGPNMYRGDDGLVYVLFNGVELSPNDGMRDEDLKTLLCAALEYGDVDYCNFVEYSVDVFPYFASPLEFAQSLSPNRRAREHFHGAKQNHGGFVLNR